MTVVVKRSSIDPQVRTIIVAGGTYRQVALEHLSRLTRTVLASYRLEKDASQKSAYEQQAGHRLELGADFSALKERAETYLSDYEHEVGKTAFLSAAEETLSLAMDPVAPLQLVLDAHIRAIHEATPAGIHGPSLVSVSADQGSLAIHIVASPGEGLRPAVMELIAEHRRARTIFTPAEVIAVQCTYQQLDRGARVESAYACWGTSGFRDHQTYMSVTDPGEGHLDGTLTRAANLRGVIVHIEHLERGVSIPREDLEPYRIPAPRTIARVRLATGEDAPTSSYVGRPMFDGAHREWSMLKTTRTFAAALSSLFADGLTECKLSIEGMSTKEALVFMKGVAAETRFDASSQILSAAFNINTPIVDDRGEREPVVVSDPFAVAMLGIDLVAESGFGKVTWDGTADIYPSMCFIEQMPPAQALALVHKAHTAGLLTYFSAGFRFHHIAAAVHTGVDGIGIGGAQILRLMDSTTGNHGPFLTNNIEHILQHRDDAERSLSGRAALALARLDRLAYERTISSQQDTDRRALFFALRDKTPIDESVIDLVLARRPDSNHPLIEWGCRLLEQEDHMATSWNRWEEFRPIIAKACGQEDLDTLRYVLNFMRSHIPLHEDL